MADATTTLDPDKAAASEQRPPVETRIAGRIGHILLNRPHAMNAVTIELLHQMDEALVSLEAQVDVIVIRGSNGNFSVGGDFHELERLQAQGRNAVAELLDAFRASCGRIRTLEIPVIAAVEGHAAAGGFEIMQSCDIALVHEHAKIADNHSNHGLVPGGGSTQRLPRLVGRQRAMAHILTGDRLTAAEAVAWGLAYRAIPAGEFDEGVENFAASLAKKNRAALAESKRLVYLAEETPLGPGLVLEREAALAHMSGDTAAAGISSFTQKRNRP